MRPFPNAHYYVGGLIAMTFAAFWPSYFAIYSKASFAHHLHGMTATAWMVLLMAQNWTIHHKYRQAHIVAGWASLALVPLFAAGGFLTMQVMTAVNNPFLQMYGFRLVSVDILALLSFCVFFALALRYRRDQRRHARYMLSTILILPVPVIARFFMNYVPGYLVRGPETLPNFGRSVEVAILLTVAFVGVLIFRDIRNRKPALPFTLALLASLLSYSGYFTWAKTDAWHQLALTYGSISPWVAAIIGILTGAVTGALGWYLGKPVRKPSPKPTATSGAEPAQA